jgi:purine-nucleoside phosphorylase
VTGLTHPQDPYALAAEAARRLLALAEIPAVDIAVVLGSGWAPVADALGAGVASFPVTELPGFAAPTVTGHSATARVVRCPGGARALVLCGRTHYYENRDPIAVAHAVRTAAAAGARAVVLTNAAGSLRTEWPPGTPVLIRDHLNLTAASPLLGGRFVDLTDAYSPALRERCRALAPELREGVYAQFGGPQYETPAEVRMAGVLGADLVGQSTALETIAAREAGLEVLGISLVTNLAAGVAPRPLDHAEVLAAGRDAADGLGALLAAFLAEW